MKNILKNIFMNIRILLKLIFSISIFDNHYIVYIFGILIRKRIKYTEEKITIINQSGINNEQRACKIIASLTTFPERIHSVSATIRTLLNQTVKPDKLILWLANSQFPRGEEELPKELLQLSEYGLTIKWCEDLKSYKKIIPALKEYPNDIIITFDDDIYYDSNIIESLYNAYEKDKGMIHTNRAGLIKLRKNKFTKIPNAYEYWWNSKPSYLNVMTGCGGVLYPPKSLNQEVLNVEAFTKIIPTQDDVWLWAMAVLNRTKINIVLGFKMNIRNVENTQQYGLCKINKSGKKGLSNLDSISIITKAYPKIMDIIKEEKC